LGLVGNNLDKAEVTRIKSVLPNCTIKFWRWTEKHKPTTWVLLQVWLEVVSFGCSSLSAAVSADGFLFVF
jgi:hypothetical protein